MATSGRVPHVRDINIVCHHRLRIVRSERRKASRRSACRHIPFSARERSRRGSSKCLQPKMLPKRP
eukprot:1942190-Prymnesium_polylepis.1